MLLLPPGNSQLQKGQYDLVDTLKHTDAKAKSYMFVLLACFQSSELSFCDISS